MHSSARDDVGWTGGDEEMAERLEGFVPGAVGTAGKSSKQSGGYAS